MCDLADSSILHGIRRQANHVLEEAKHLAALVELGREAGEEIPGDVLALLGRIGDARA